MEGAVGEVEVGFDAFLGFIIIEVSYNVMISKE